MSYDSALALRSDYVEALVNRANVLHRVQRFNDALASYERAIALRPQAEVLTNRGNTLQQLKRFDEALVSYRRAQALQEEYQPAHWNESLLLLLTGDWQRGWEKYEWRWKGEGAAGRSREFPKPLWRGADSIDGKTILLHGEQGFGDVIQFARYAALVRACGAHVVLEVHKALQELMTGRDGVSRVIARGDALPYFDVHCPLLSLPLAFGTTVETIPSAIPYLKALPQAARIWEAQLGRKDRPRVGIVWASNAKPDDDYNRSKSMPARSLLPLFDVKATFVSLQKTISAADAAILDQCNDILNLGERLNDFSVTAALVSELDLVISVDTSVAHLAGALGKPIWVLLPFIPDWRWLLDREDSPWYPTARLFRQSENRKWDGVIDRVRVALHNFVAGP